MKKQRTLTVYFTLLLAAMLTFACGLPSLPDSPPKSTQPPAGEVPALAGDALLPEPGAGIATLNNYTAILITTFEGTRSTGEPYQSASTLQHVNIRAGETEMTVLESTDSASQPVYLLTGKSEGLNFLQVGKEAECQAVSPDRLDAPLEMPFPANQLPMIASAVKVGSATVNGVDAIQYRLEQGSLPAYPNSPTSGDVWLSVLGNWVVSYHATVQLTSADSNNTLQGELSWRYDLTPGTSSLPWNDSCKNLPLDFPRLPDASLLSIQPGYLEYISPAAVQDAANKIQVDMVALGWTILGEGSTSAPLVFHRMDGEIFQYASILVSPAENGSRIKVMTTEVDPQTLEAAADITPVAPPTLDPAAAGLPDGIPVYPGARDMTGMADKMLLFMVDDPLDTVQSYYLQAMQASNFELLMQQAETMQWQKEKMMVSINLQNSDSGTQVVIVWFAIP